jgi:hypothetical protein
VKWIEESVRLKGTAHRPGVARTPGEGAHILGHFQKAARILACDLQDDGRQPAGHERNSDELEQTGREGMRYP